MRVKEIDKEEQIYKAALKLIFESGLMGLKMSVLAKEANVATGTIYLYVKDKADLISKLNLYLMKQSLLDINKNVLKKDPLKLKIKKSAYNYLIYSYLHPEYAAFFEQYYRSPYFETNNELAEAENDILKPIYNLVAEGQQQGIIKSVDAEMMVSMVCSILDDFVNQTLYSKKGIDDAKWDITFMMIWDAIKS